MSDEDDEYDVVVVGSGAAGMTAAVSAASRGLEVVVLERNTRIGGTSAISGGWLYLPGNPSGAGRTGDTRGEILCYLRGLAGDALDERRVHEFLDGVPELIGFLERTRVELVDPPLSPDYRMLVPGARESGRSLYAKPVDARVLGGDRLRLRAYKQELTVLGVMPQIGPDLTRFLHANSSWSDFGYVLRRVLRNWSERALFRRGLDLSNGNGLMARLLATATDLGVEVRTDARVSALVRGAHGVGGVALTSGNRTGTIRARRGVVLAAGGFSHDPHTRGEVFPSDVAAAHRNSPMTPEHDGASLRLAGPFGGHLDRAVVQPAAWATVTVFERDRVFPHLRGVGLPGIIAVDGEGRRFTNEADSYHDFGPAVMKAAEGRAAEPTAHLVTDAATMRRYGLGYAKPWPMPRLRHLLSGYLVRAGTLPALAARIGADPPTLVRTVDRFNRFAARGEDPDFGRGIGAFNRFKGDPDNRPNPTLRPLGAGPYYAVQVRVGDLGTFAGLATGPRGAVLDADQHPVPGLYAVGSAAVSVFGGSYPGAGAHLGPAMVFGYLAGQDMADHPDPTRK